MKVSNSGLARVAAFEACVLSVYADAHNPAIGFGQNDPNLKAGDSITLDDAVALLVNAAPRYEQGIDRIFAGLALKQTQFDALFSLAYNIGVGGLSNETRLVTAVKSFLPAPSTDPAYHTLRDLAGFEFTRAHWSATGGPFNFSRRCREALLFVSGDYGDISTLQLWGPGKNPRTDPPEHVPMPVFRTTVPPPPLPKET